MYNFKLAEAKVYRLKIDLVHTAGKQNFDHLHQVYSSFVQPLTLALFGIPIPTAAVVPASTGRIAPVIHLA
jgi:hypothetical protein